MDKIINFIKLNNSIVNFQKTKKKTPGNLFKHGPGYVKIEFGPQCIRTPILSNPIHWWKARIEAQ